MRKKHLYDSSYIYTAIYLDLFNDKIIDVREITEELNYDISSVYNLIRKIRCNLTILSTNYELQKVEPYRYKLVNNSPTPTKSK